VLKASPATLHLHVLPGVEHFFLGSGAIALGERLRASVVPATNAP